jgi:hypothetical protein
MLLVVGVDAVDPRAVPAGTGKRTHVVLAIAAGTNILKSILIFVVVAVAVAEVLDTILITKAFVVDTWSLTMASLQTGNRSTDRAGED